MDVVTEEVAKVGFALMYADDLVLIYETKVLILCILLK